MKESKFRLKCSSNLQRALIEYTGIPNHHAVISYAKATASFVNSRVCDQEKPVAVVVSLELWIAGLSWLKRASNEKADG